MPTISPRRVLSLLLSVVTLTTLSACAPVDLRPQSLADATSIDEGSENEARVALAKMLDAHGGLDVWRAQRTARITFHDNWPSRLMRAVVMPWPGKDATLQQDILLGQDTSRLTFLDTDEEGSAWGIQNWVTYTVEKGGEPVIEEHEDAWFWLPTVEYFFEAPFRLHEGEYVSHAGTRERDGKKYEVIYITWGSVEPTRDIDQYVAWIGEESGRLEILQYTVRDFGKRIQGAAYYEDYAQIQGLWVAKTIRIADFDDRDDVLHIMTFDSIDYGIDLPDSYFYPAPEKSASKQAKGEAE